MKKINHSGFSLIELLIASFIASIIALILFSSLYQINKFIPRVNNLSQNNEKAALVNAQLERDLSGTTAPFEYYLRQKQEEKPGQKKQEEEKKKNEHEKKEKETKEQAEPTQQKKPPLEKIFYGNNKNNMLDQ